MKIIQSLFGSNGASDKIQQALAQAEPMEQTGPWKRLSTMGIGGLTALGFDRSSEDMLVTSATGQSVISGTTGDILYRNRDHDGLDMAALKGTRLDHPAEERFDMAGLFGGGLRRVTNDDWSVEQVNGCAILSPRNASIHFLGPAWESYTKDPTFHLLERAGENIRVLGFSWTGRTLVCATSSTLSIWSRPAPLRL